MSRIKRGIAGMIGIGIIAGILLFCSGRYGDPLSEANAKRRAVAYAKKLYPEQSFTAQGVRYTKPFVYIVDVQSNESTDTYFSVKVSFWTHRKVQIDIGYIPEASETENGYREIPEQYRSFLPLDQNFEPDVLQQIPARFAAVLSWPKDPTEADLAEVLKKVKDVLAENGMPIAYYHITLLHEAGMKEEAKWIEADNVSEEQIG